MWWVFVLFAALVFAAPQANAANYYWFGDNVGNPTAWNTAGGLGGTNWSTSPDSNQGNSGPNPLGGDNIFFYLINSNANFATNLTANVLGADYSINSIHSLAIRHSPSPSVVPTLSPSVPAVLR